jgi:hypothetical protein
VGLRSSAILSSLLFALISCTGEISMLRAITPVAERALIGSLKYSRAAPRMKSIRLKVVQTFLIMMSKKLLLTGDSNLFTLPSETLSLTSFSVSPLGSIHLHTLQVIK